MGKPRNPLRRLSCRLGLCHARPTGYGWACVRCGQESFWNAQQEAAAKRDRNPALIASLITPAEAAAEWEGERIADLARLADPLL